MSDRPAREPGVFDQTFLMGVEGVTEVLLIRHGQQDADFYGPVGGVIDPPLSEHGRAQASLLGQALSTVHLDAIFASPLRRALETAEGVQKHHKHLELHVMDDLKEVGIFQDVPPEKTAEEFVGRELLLAVRQRMLNERSWDVYPYSESSFDFKKRTVNAIETAIARNIGERIAIVCHGGVINAYIGHIVQSQYDMFFRPGHTSVSIVASGEGRRVLRGLNDMNHLRTAEGDFGTY
jgi:broad specificity phosphatase PhoE